MGCVTTDLFELKGSTYLLVTDYYSRFVEVQKLSTTSSSFIVTQLKVIFARFGILGTLITVNGPQFDSQHMKEFAQAYEFQHTTTSPYYPQANALAEIMVKAVKKLLEHSADAYKALLSYKATPLAWCRYSPAELLMGRKIRTDVPQLKDNLIPKWAHVCNFRSLDEKYCTSRCRKRIMISTTVLEPFHYYQKIRLRRWILEDTRLQDEHQWKLVHLDHILLKDHLESSNRIEHIYQEVIIRRHYSHKWIECHYPLTACHSLTDRNNINYLSPRLFTI